MSRTYATEAELTAYLDPEPAPAGAARLLRDASLEVDEMLFTAIYCVDHDGNPTEAPVIEALRDATCAQAEYRAEYGDELEALNQGESIKLGPVSFGGAFSSGPNPKPLPRYAPKALRYLRLAGLIPGSITDG
ncbi:hypothetical protein MUN78_04440 [Leucobacter allii]|uniref:Head-to-tail adaptor n=1 Tax=Leucobacter allii TaxID=2932247 RepID=A0ABY4FP85_9MICO|nr:hypothetical protein [Leucobacter allii]UOQ58100.1 hypothetical protein MUN78_04440 [Leucobacter allii]